MKVSVIVTVLVYYVFSAGAGAMLPPVAGQERTFYGYLFRFIQTLAANSHRVAFSRLAALSASAERKPAPGVPNPQPARMGDDADCRADREHLTSHPRDGGTITAEPETHHSDRSFPQ